MKIKERKAPKYENKTLTKHIGGVLEPRLKTLTWDLGFWILEQSFRILGQDIAGNKFQDFKTTLLINKKYFLHKQQASTRCFFFFRNEKKRRRKKKLNLLSKTKQTENGLD